MILCNVKQTSYNTFSDFFSKEFESSCYQLPPVKERTDWNASGEWDQTTDMPNQQGRLYAAATTILDSGIINDYIWYSCRVQLM